MTRRQVMVLALVVEAGMGAVAVVLGLALGLPVADWVRPSLSGLAWGLAGGALLMGILVLCRRFPVGPIGKLMRFVESRVTPLFRQCRMVDLLVLSVLAGVGEELLFRGFLQGVLEAHLHVWTALIITSILFGLAHCITREYVVFAAVLGALLGWLAILTGDLTASITAHAAYDFGALMLMTRAERQAACQHAI